MTHSTSAKHNLLARRRRYDEPVRAPGEAVSGQPDEELSRTTVGATLLALQLRHRTQPINSSGEPFRSDRKGRRRLEDVDPAAVGPPNHAPQLPLALSGVLVVLGGPLARSVAPYNSWVALGSLLLLAAGLLLALAVMARMLHIPSLDIETIDRVMVRRYTQMLRVGQFERPYAQERSTLLPMEHKPVRSSQL